ncbi:hypothetical protein I4U23_005265 [Adineta vaga]|nr:hypothetical protein I4U23_005265 [Adineta vaga]
MKVFLFSLYIIFYITLLQPHSEIINVFDITHDIIEQLRMEHAETLSCPCKITSISYKTFMTNTITLHPVCSSIFVTDAWAEAFYLQDPGATWTQDFTKVAYSVVIQAVGQSMHIVQ